MGYKFKVTYIYADKEVIATVVTTGRNKDEAIEIVKKTYCNILKIEQVIE